MRNNKFFRIGMRYIKDLAYLDRSEYRALFGIILYSSVDFRKYEIVNFLSNEFALSNKVIKDVEKGLDELIHRNLLTKRSNRYYINTEILTIGLYTPSRRCSSDYDYVKIYASYVLVDMLKESSKLDLNIGFSLLKDITYYEICENIVRVNTKRKEELSNEFKRGKDSINKSLMKLKKVGFLIQAPSKYENKQDSYSKNKFIISTELIYKGTEIEKNRNRPYNRGISKEIYLESIENKVNDLFSLAKNKYESKVLIDELNEILKRAELSSNYHQEEKNNDDEEFNIELILDGYDNLE